MAISVSHTISPPQHNRLHSAVRVTNKNLIRLTRLVLSWPPWTGYKAWDKLPPSRILPTVASCPLPLPAPGSCSVLKHPFQSFQQACFLQWGPASGCASTSFNGFTTCTVLRPQSMCFDCCHTLASRLYGFLSPALVMISNSFMHYSTMPQWNMHWSRLFIRIQPL